MGFSSSAKSCSILVVEAKSAKLQSETKGSFYFFASINEGLAKSKSMTCTEVSKPAWNQRFVFSVPRRFTLDKNSSVSFKIFRSRKFGFESLVGEAASKIETLFPTAEEGYCKSDDENNCTSFKGGSWYDFELDFDYSNRSDSEERPPKEEIFELNASVELPILKDSAVVGSLSIAITAWQRSPSEGNVNPAKKNIPIFRDLFRVGTLNVNKTQQVNCISLVGNQSWGTLAMDYEEFMMCRTTHDEETKDKKKPKPSKSRKSIVICCIKSTETSTKH